MASQKTTVPARLQVLLARSAPVGIILRRGPSRWVQVIRWNTAKDTFEPGHWFKGRIYMERSDLSPSGDRFIYLAAKHASSRPYDPTYTKAWTAISKVPYLTAVALWSNRDGTYFGGGLFGDDNTVWLNSIDAVYFDPPSVVPHPNHCPPDSVTVIPNPVAFLSDGKWLYYQYPEYARRLRDGWTWHEDGRTPSFEILHREELRRQYLPRELYRRNPRTDWILHLRLPSFLGKEKDTYFLHWGKANAKSIEELSGVAWADWDQQGRLVCAREGKLYEIKATTWREHVRAKTTQERLEWREIADFNDARPRLLPPPDWAKVW